MYTDNFVAKDAFWKGTSSSKELLELILRLNPLELSHALHSDVNHISRNWMIAQGIDSLSRAEFIQGTMRDGIVVDKVLLELGAHERSDNSVTWFNSSCTEIGTEESIYLSKEDWFDHFDKSR